MTGLTLDGLRRTGTRTLAGASALLAAILIAAALFAGGGKLVAIPLALALMALPGMIVLRDRADLSARLTVAVTPPVLTGLLLFVAEGHVWQTELHMIFFATLAATVILCDWRPVAAATAVTAVHHLLLGLLLPDWVFTGGGSLARVLLHAVILLSETAVLMWTSRRLVDMFDSIAAQGEERRAAEASAAALRDNEAKSQALLLGVLGESLSALRDGDLRGEIEAEFPSAWARLKSDYNGAVGSLRVLIASVGESAGRILAESSDIADAAADLAQRTRGNSGRLEASAQAIDQIDARLRSTADAAARTVARADQSIATVENGRGVAAAAMTAMGRVADSAKGIDDVIEGLDKIAFQTRVLAMNAAVEAGRAGEAGRGFAVVADLVSALAMRAEEEAKRAREQLTFTQGEIVGAVGSVRDVDAALAGISGDVAEVHALLGAIAADNRAQSVAISSVSETVQAMNGSTRQDAAMVEQTSNAVRTLVAEVEALAADAGRFLTDKRRVKRGPERLAARQLSTAA